MTAECFADLVRARPVGRLRWMARCPAHNDSSPSLSIAEGEDGRVLVLCRAGCETNGILAALRLTVRDLFAGPPAMPQQAAILAAERNAKAARERQQRAIGRETRDRVWKLVCIRDALGAKLARSPDEAALGKLFHLACDRLHESETALYPVAPELGGMRLPEPFAGAPWVSESLTEIGRNLSLTEIGRNFNLKRTATRCERAA